MLATPTQHANFSTEPSESDLGSARGTRWCDRGNSATIASTLASRSSLVTASVSPARQAGRSTQR